MADYEKLYHEVREDIIGTLKVCHLEGVKMEVRDRLSTINDNMSWRTVQVCLK